MKNEIRSLLDQVLQSGGAEGTFAMGDYTITSKANEIELQVQHQPIARFILNEHRLVTVDWNYIKENRYLAYRLEQLGYPVHADPFLK